MNYEEEFQDAESVQEASELAVNFILDHFQAERILVMFAEEQGFVTHATHGFDPRTVWSYSQFSKGLMAAVYDEGKPLLLADAGSDPKHGGRVSVVLSGLRSVMCVPLKTREGQVLGLLYADSRIQKGAFTPEDLDRLVGLGSGMEKRLATLRQR